MNTYTKPVLLTAVGALSLALPFQAATHITTYGNTTSHPKALTAALIYTTLIAITGIITTHKTSHHDHLAADFIPPLTGWLIATGLLTGWLIATGLLTATHQALLISPLTATILITTTFISLTVLLTMNREPLTPTTK